MHSLWTKLVSDEVGIKKRGKRNKNFVNPLRDYSFHTWWVCHFFLIMNFLVKNKWPQWLLSILSKCCYFVLSFETQTVLLLLIFFTYLSLNGNRALLFHFLKFFVIFPTPFSLFSDSTFPAATSRIMKLRIQELALIRRIWRQFLRHT